MLNLELIRTTLIGLSGIVAIACVWPYLRDVLSGKTKPRLLTWSVWTFLNVTAAIASFTEGGIAAGWLALFETIATGAVVIAGLRSGDRRLTGLDLTCLSGVVAGLVVWHLSGDARWGLYISLLVDFMGGIPTIAHCWRKPFEETFSTYALSIVSAVLALLAVDHLNTEALAFPLYLLIVDGMFTGILAYRRRVTPKRKPALRKRRALRGV